MEISPRPVAAPSDSDPVTKILDAAERLAMTRGFTRFSYADIAAELGVTKPALHYHFRTKALLGQALVQRYTQRFFAELERIDASVVDPQGKLERYADLYRSVLCTGRMCLCGMLAAEYQTLPTGMRSAVSDFFERNEHWLLAVLSNGHVLDPAQAVAAQATARSIIDTLEGAMLLARAFDDVARFDASAHRLLASVRERIASIELDVLPHA